MHLQNSQKIKNKLQMNLMLVVTAKHKLIVSTSGVWVHSTSNGTQNNCATGYLYIILLICNQLLFMSHATEGIKGKEVSSRKQLWCSWVLAHLKSNSKAHTKLILFIPQTAFSQFNWAANTASCRTLWSYLISDLLLHFTNLDKWEQGSNDLHKCAVVEMN